MKKRIIGMMITALALTSCATYQPETNTYSDPLSGVNKAMFNVNYYALDPYILRPAAVVWKDYVPSPVRKGVVNFSSNLSEPASMVNNLLQGEVHQASTHLARFFINTVFGVAGVFDVASMADPQLKKGNRRSFGDVLGHYDVPYGPYVVLPFYGSATLRQEGGDLVDTLYPPLVWLDWQWALARGVVDGIEARAVAIEYEDMLKNSDDPYNFMRNAYFQRNDFNASGGKVDQQKQQQREESINSFINDIDSQ
ncbi:MULTISPECIES: MlaA family lipoprotein [unclassified Gilliamella]|uniref:MlaA family lipoprotein n=1 Tax=unclassified Gilliamella TaxID=2685620 RepID=UPI00226A1B27|nr:MULTISPECIES: MlaA family lipoprotein [unclassified Gilliamella]MCX8602435.1 VacJ family lipoprotein [Gilliamella sp. B3722]MCX8608019.1 VacJ family lipoprotein [Gilliamella sp. B3771]MCX8611594.1 VacJ family lipoprotein [Gilliamella sp. B3891]MCX8614138.1 VacJ family lipoprotein [Gilliamella sp. B3773]MCX8621406.1 VacJ family lipoprotein [Gilliamella sp. B3892]